MDLWPLLTLALLTGTGLVGCSHDWSVDDPTVDAATEQDSAANLAFSDGGPPSLDPVGQDADTATPADASTGPAVPTNQDAAEPLADAQTPDAMADGDNCVAGACAGGECIDGVGDYSCRCNSGLFAVGRTCARFRDNVNGTVSDAQSGLTWQHPPPSGVFPSTSHPFWDGPAAYCRGLAHAGGGWHLPTIEELRTIVDTRYVPTIDPNYFPGTPEAWFLSADTVDGMTESPRLAVNFAIGNQYYVDTGHVRCVR